LITDAFGDENALFGRYIFIHVMQFVSACADL
jgi:hypothetical protein